VKMATAEGVDLVFNTPNPQSGAGYLKMGWREVGPIGVMARPLGRFWRRSESLPKVTGSSRWDDRDVSDRSPLGLRTPRRADYLRWRYGRHPTARYSVVDSRDGLTVMRSNVRNRRGELVVSDLFGTGAARAVRQAARSTDAGYMVGWASKHLPERERLVSAGLLPVPRLAALTLVARPLRAMPLEVTDPRSWDLMLGDLELL
jgi:hypothetical protein